MENVGLQGRYQEIGSSNLQYLPMISGIIAGLLLITENPTHPDDGYEYVMTKIVFLAIVIMNIAMAAFGSARIKASKIKLVTSEPVD